MKIGIMTFWTSNSNYGQILQCFALQHILRSMGHEPYLIRYDVSSESPVRFHLNNWYKVVLLYPIVRKLRFLYKRRKEKNLMIELKAKDKIREFDSFKNEYINMSNRLYSSFVELRQEPPAADCYIAGSDQIWSRPIETEDVKARYLDFGSESILRMSYAASFGMKNYPKKYIKELHKALNKFDAVSVRENTGVDICTQAGIKANLVIDPTLLLTKEEYKPLIQKPSVESGYIFIYQINIEKPMEICWTDIQTYANKKKLKTITVTSSGYVPGREILEGTTYIYASIPQWLGYIMYSNFVVTTSFHGIAFCLILHKNFIYFPLKGIHSDGNDRILSLLRILKLENKVYSSEQDIVSIIEKPINWNEVDFMLNQLKDDSIDFLKNNIGINHINI